MDEHIIEALGLAKIKIKDGKIVDFKPAKIDYCPLFHNHRGIEKLDEKSIKNNINFRIKDFGMCTADRKLKLKDFLTFGISEILSTLLEEKIIDCAILVCEGCGTVILSDGECVQGVGGRVSGLVSTSPIPEVIARIGKENVVNPKTAEINQIEGIKKAISQGYKNIAVTITIAKDIKEINKIKEENPDINIYTFVVHTSGLSYRDAEELFMNSDVITGCASKHIREIGKRESIKTVGQSIPIYARTEEGKKFLEIRLKKIGGGKPKKDNPKIPYPLI